MDLSRQEMIDYLRFSLTRLEARGVQYLPIGSDQFDAGRLTANPPQVTKEIAKADGPDSFAKLAADLDGCTRCKLSAGRTNIVISRGNPKADLMFIGEGPGRDEDRQGKPFVGRAGQLLDKIIAAMGFGRDEVYIANIVKCRPPQNRNPEEDEVETCLPFLHRQIALVQPKVICLLGSVALRALLGNEERISRVRGKFLEYRGVPTLPTYHPAFLLRNPNMKRAVWEDVQKISAKLSRDVVKTERGQA